MLIYHPAYDAYHCIFRALIITNSLKTLELSKLRLIDFFLMFPSELKNITLPRGHSRARRIAGQYTNQYHGPVSRNQTFRDMQHIQSAAYSTLAASEIFEPTSYSKDIISRTTLAIPNDLQTALTLAEKRDEALLEYLLGDFASVPLQGANGLKAKTGLMEYRYDVA